MTSQKVKFYKFTNSTTSADRIAAAKAVQGAIIYIVDVNELWIGGATAQAAELVVKGANNVTFADNVLTITHYGADGQATTNTLNFSDVASASSTMAVFEQLYTKIGLTGNAHDTIDYSNTNYLADLGTGEQPAKNLVNADRALDAAIKGVADSVANLDVTEYEQATVDTTTSNTETTVKIKSIKEVDGKIEAGTATTDLKVDGTYNASTNKIASQSTVANAVKKGAATGAQYDTTASEISSTWISTVNNNEIAANDTFDADIDKLDKKIAGLADELIRDEQVINQTVDTISDSIGLENDFSLDLSHDTTHIIENDDNVKDALQSLANAIGVLQGDFDVIKSTDAATTPAGVVWTDTSTTPATTVTGTLVASATTWHKVYLVPANGGSGSNSYDEYITTRTGSGDPVVYTYAWERLGTIDVDLTGFVKTITVNGVSHAVDNNSVNISLGNVVNAISGETAIAGNAGGESGLSAVTASDSVDANGVRTTTLASTVKVEEVADGLTKDGTPSYTAGHYVIENGKLVSAAGKSTGDTYTKSANDGLTKASDVKAYVDSAVANLFWENYE